MSTQVLYIRLVRQDDNHRLDVVLEQRFYEIQVGTASWNSLGNVIDDREDSFSLQFGGPVIQREAEGLGTGYVRSRTLM